MGFQIFKTNDLDGLLGIEKNAKIFTATEKPLDHKIRHAVHRLHEMSSIPDLTGRLGDPPVLEGSTADVVKAIEDFEKRMAVLESDRKELLGTLEKFLEN